MTAGQLAAGRMRLQRMRLQGVRPPMAAVVLAVTGLLLAGCGSSGGRGAAAGTTVATSTTTADGAGGAAAGPSSTVTVATTVPTTTAPPTTMSTTTTIATRKPVAATTATTATTARAARLATTTTSTARVPRDLHGLQGAVIAVDPGHNGANGSHPKEINRQVDAGGFQKACDTTGTQTVSGYTESAYTFDVANRLVAVLRAAGATVVVTRATNDGVGPCIDERAEIGNRAGADAAVSIHADGGPTTGRGFHVIEPALVKGYTEPIVEPSARLGTALRDAFRDGTGMPVSTYIGRDGIDVRGDLGGLNRSHVPKVFIETGNMRNTTDAHLLADADFRQRAAEAIAAALSAYLGGG